MPVITITVGVIRDIAIRGPYPNIIIPGEGVAIIYVTTIIGSFSYALIRPRYIKKYLKQGLEQALIEFGTIKKIIPIIVVIILVTFLVTFLLIIPSNPNQVVDILTLRTKYNPNSLYSLYLGSFNFSSVVFMLVGISSLLMYILIISEKEFRFNLAKTCFMGALNKKDVFRQMYYFSLGLREYNRYLKRYLKHQIKDIDKIFSKVSLLDNNDTITEVIHSLSNSFETETDKLKPLRYISSELMKSEDIESFLVPESLKSRLKVVGTFLAALIPIVISIITLLLSTFRFKF